LFRIIGLSDGVEISDFYGVLYYALWFEEKMYGLIVFINKSLGMID